MRSIFISIILLLLCNTTFSQVDKVERNQQFYLEKSKRQKTTAWILFGTGSAMLAIAAPGNVSFDILPVLVVGGTGAILGSIPLFIASGKNKRRAATFSSSLKLSPSPNMSNSAISGRSIPMLSLVIVF